VGAVVEIEATGTPKGRYPGFLSFLGSCSALLSESAMSA
jgi:hypothetical protein